MAVDRLMNGAWVECTLGPSCSALFHVPSLTAEEAEALPLHLLLPLLEVLDPPSHVYPDGEKVWQDAQGHGHREYDLPALVNPDGTLIWYWHGARHRLHDRPAAIFASGTLCWYQDDRRHRDGRKPAMIEPDGTQYWYIQGLFQSPTPHNA
jgi:hypothetical protein